MRMLLKARLSTEQGNRAIQAGTMEKTIMAIVEELKPEAVYFTPDEGRRCALVFFDMQDPSELPRITEPFFMDFDAEVSVQPVMTVEDARKGLAAIAGGS